MQLVIDHLSEIHSVAKSFLDQTQGHKIFAFEGEMGAGKTTFINAILDIMKIEDHSSSPTFSIVNEYLSPLYGSVFHFDFYRIEDEEEALDIGVEDIIYNDDYCFMEWPSKIENLLPENTVLVKITVNNQRRIIDIQL
ncbi:MAG: tRNA (adenosine(37)-N6)-threonylcarbamoyltransferase complex ATPase subunit type 1 TsaE [Putridiphycobacter sp.]